MSRDSEEKWSEWRKTNLGPIQTPVEGFSHAYGQDLIDAVDQRPLGFKKILDPITEASLSKGKDDVAVLIDSGHEYGSTKSPSTFHFWLSPTAPAFHL